MSKHDKGAVYAIGSMVAMGAWCFGTPVMAVLGLAYIGIGAVVVLK